jgi:PBSX family phage terminase large subunit
MFLTPSQSLIAKDTHRFRVLRCGRRFGKDLDINTDILTINGFKKLKDLKVGEFVFTEKGKPTKILYKSPIYKNRKCYQVKFSDGTFLIASGTHDWLVEDRIYRKNISRNKKTSKKILKLTTEQIKEKLYIKRKDGKFETNFSIPLTLPVHFKKKQLKIPPYMFGQWLGDGNSNSFSITTNDEETILRIYEYAKELNMFVNESRKRCSNVSTYSIRGKRNKEDRDRSLVRVLKELKVFKNKHIPNDYKYSSIEQRVELLKGLMDSDGYISQKGYCEYCSVNKNLANDIYELIISLGIKATINESASKIYGRLVGNRYRIHFTTDLNIFELKRKQNRNISKRKKDIYRRFIVDVIEVETRPTQCLMVDNLTHLFLAGRDLISTHNTILNIEEMKGVALAKPNKIAYCATTIQQARDIVWKELLKELQGAIIKTNEARLEILTKTLQGGESQISLRGWENIETLRGLAFDFLGIDEVASMRNFWINWNEVLRPTLTDRKGQAMFSSTPKGFNHFYDLCNRELTDKDFKSFHFTTWDNPHIPREEIESAKATLPEETFLQEYEASFQKMQGLVFKEFERHRHLYEELPQGNYEKIAGADFGYRNPSAVLDIYSDGERFYIEDEWYKRERTDAQIAEYIASCKFSAVYPDPENPGAIEELRRRGVNTREVTKGKGSVQAGIQKIKELFLNSKLKINKKCVNLIAELEMYSYEESKNELNEKENPTKAFDHAIDAMRYAIMTYSPTGLAQREQELYFNRARQDNLRNSTR